MTKTEKVREAIISAAVELIIEGTGNIDEITTRAIATRANVGVGLINYHFQTKENLIEICVQQIIGEVISSFEATGGENLTETGRVTSAAIQVFDFLFENPAVSRISILGDIRSPALNDNTMKTMKGFKYSLQESKLTENDRNFSVFVLTSAMQTAFLRKDSIKELFENDLNVKSERDSFLINLVKKIYGGFCNE